MRFFSLREPPSWWEQPLPYQCAAGHKNQDLFMKGVLSLVFCKRRWSPTISAKSSVTLTGLRRSVTLSNSSNSVVGKLTSPSLHTSPAEFFMLFLIFFLNLKKIFIPVNLRPLSKAWKWGTPTSRPSLTSSPPTHTSWSSCQTPPFVSSKGDISLQLRRI